MKWTLSSAGMALFVSVAVFTSGTASATAPRPTPKNPAACRVAKTRAKCRTRPGTTTTSAGQATGSAGSGTGTTTTGKKAGAGKSTGGQWPYDGRYRSVATIHTHVIPPPPQAPVDKSETVQSTFIVIHGKTSLVGAVGPISNAGQLQIAQQQPGLGALAGTLFFVLGANDAVDVHGQLHLQHSVGSAVMDETEEIEATRISR